jgi:hypothetical protein
MKFLLCCSNTQALFRGLRGDFVIVDGDDLGDRERSGVVGSFATDLLAVLGVPRSILFGRVMLVVKMT